MGASLAFRLAAFKIEQPQNPKRTIDAVIDDLVEAKLIRVLAKLRPLITYKTRLTHRE